MLYFCVFLHPEWMQVNNNGMLSFGTAISQYSPKAFPLGDGQRFIAPYWADVDTRLPFINPIIIPNGRSPNETGRVWYREVQSELFERVAQEVRRAFVDQTNFYPSWLFIATWEAVGYYDQHIDRVSEVTMKDFLCLALEPMFRNAERV